MRTAAVAFVLAALCSVLLTPMVRDLACRLGWLDHGLTSRKVHGRPVPRLGGVAIVVAFYAPLLALLVVDSATGKAFLADEQRAFGLFAGGVAITALGLWDDFRGTGAGKKFLVQFAVAYAMYQLGFRVEQIAIPFGDPIPLGWLGLPFTLLWIVGVVNAMNLIDGLDGLAGGIALIAVGTTFVVAFQRGQGVMMLFTAALAGALLGFLRYNFNPASIFMGDAGSMFLGFVLATSAIQTHQKSSTAVAMFIPVVALGLPIGDTLLSMTRRAIRGAPLFHSDKGHIHHRLMAIGLSHRQTVLVLYGLCLLLGATAIALTRISGVPAALLLVGLFALAVGLLHRVGYIRFGAADEVLRERSRNLEARASIREIGEMLRGAGGADDVWACVKQAAPAVGAACVQLQLVDRRPGERATLQFCQGFDEAPAGLFRARYSLLGERPDDGAIELGWSDGRARVDRDTEIAVELLCEHALNAVQRVACLRAQDRNESLGQVMPLGRGK